MCVCERQSDWVCERQRVCVVVGMGMGVGIGGGVGGSVGVFVSPPRGELDRSV